MTYHLIPLLLKSGNPKVINASSEAHRTAKVDFDDPNFNFRPYISFVAYANAKLFNILFTKSLAEKYMVQGLLAIALNPGVIKSGFGRETPGIFKLLWKLATPFLINTIDGAKRVFIRLKPK